MAVKAKKNPVVKEKGAKSNVVPKMKFKTGWAYAPAPE